MKTVVPVTSPEELERQREDKKEQKRQAEPIPADALIDKDAEAQTARREKTAELAAKKAEEEQQHKKNAKKSNGKPNLSVKKSCVCKDRLHKPTKNNKNV